MTIKSSWDDDDGEYPGDCSYFYLASDVHGFLLVQQLIPIP
jgi:hypothetical protein